MSTGKGDAHLIEKGLSSELVFKGKLLEVRRDRIALPDGGEATREYIVHPGAVLVVPILPDGRLVLERQYRYPVGRVMLEFPAGKIDPGEAPLATAKRELVEEVGYEASHWTVLGTVHPEIGYSTEFIELFVAAGLVHVGARLDDGEFLDVVTMTEDELLAAFDRGEVTDGKTVAALFAWQRLRLRGPRALRIEVRGRVQGVGFRDATRNAAVDCGVSGWVRNRLDGSVEVLAQGSPEALERFLVWCRRGPALARVDAVTEVVAVHDPALAGFEQRSTR